MGRLAWLAAICLSASAGILAADGPSSDEPGARESDRDLLAGRAALADGFYSVAEASFEAYIASFKSSIFPARRPLGLLYLVRALHGQERYRDALARLESGADVIKGSAVEPDLTYWYARCAMDAGDPGRALDLLRTFEGRFPGSPVIPSVVRLRTEIHLASGRVDDALSGFADFHQRFPDHPGATANLFDWAQTYLARTNLVRARDRLEELVRRYPDDARSDRARLLLTELPIPAGETDRTDEWLQSITSRDGVEPVMRAEAWTRRGERSRAAGDLRLAFQFASNACAEAIGPEQTLRSGLLLARIESLSGDVTGALTRVSGLASNAPGVRGRSAALLLKGDLLYALGRHAAALEAYEDALSAYEIEPEKDAAHLGRGVSLQAMGQYAAAVAALDRVSATGMRYDDALRASAISFFKAGDFSNSLVRLIRLSGRRATATDTSNDRFLEAECRLRLGQIKDGQKILRQVVDAHAGTATAERALLRIKDSSEEAGLWEEVLHVCEELLLTVPSGQRRADALLSRAQARLASAALDSNAVQAALADYDAVAQQFAGTDEAGLASVRAVRERYRAGMTNTASEQVEKFLEHSTSVLWRARMEFARGEAKYNAASYVEARASFQRITGQVVQVATGLADDALFWAARCASETGGYAEAVVDLQTLISRYGTSELIHDALLAQATALEALQKDEEAVKVLRRLTSDCKDSELLSRAQLKLGSLLLKLAANGDRSLDERRKWLDDAREVYRGVASLRGPAEPSARTALMAAHGVASVQEAVARLFLDQRRQGDDVTASAVIDRGNLQAAIDLHLNVFYEWRASAEHDAGDASVMRLVIRSCRQAVLLMQHPLMKTTPATFAKMRENMRVLGVTQQEIDLLIPGPGVRVSAPPTSPGSP